MQFFILKTEEMCQKISTSVTVLLTDNSTRLVTILKKYQVEPTLNMWPILLHPHTTKLLIQLQTHSANQEHEKLWKRCNGDGKKKET
jgi:hypothetical protein